MAPNASSELKIFSLAEVQQHNTPESLWMIINDKVYDLTKFAMEHPGGEEVLFEQGGQDATEPFNDVGHSSDAREMAEEYVIGRIADDERKSAKAAVGDNSKAVPWSEILLSPTWTNFLIPAGISILVYATYRTASKLLTSF
uniref:Cytochrome b5 n=1 Tax=Panagrellus redivivus TaxID=6233 RepID=A0A7E4ZW66_PANRE